MVLSKREQIIAVVTLVIVGLLIGDKLVFTPVLGKLKALEDERADLKLKLDTANILFMKQKKMQAQWKQLTADFPNEQQTQSKVSNSLNQWSEKWGLKLSSTRPERVPNEKGLQEMLFAYSGTGTMGAVASFIWEIETSPLPLKITSMQLSSPDAGEQMQVTLNVSAVYPGTASKNTRANEAGAKSNEEEVL
jgi:hypothetical protein